MKPDYGEIIVYQSEDGQAAIDVHLRDETVWLTQAQMVELFQRDKRTISEHIRNVFKEGELIEKAVVRKFRTTAADGKKYQTNFYNLDVIISVGYRVKSQRGTQFRIWATSVLKDHLVKGYTFNRKRLAEKGTQELQQVVGLLSRTLEDHDLVSDEGKAILDIVRRYARTWRILLQYDENNLPFPEKKHEVETCLDLDQVRQSFSALKQDLAARGEATDLFGRERGGGLAGIIGAIQQTFGGRDLYPSVEEKAAHLLYFVIKDHPFLDGNKRIGSFLFVLFLKMNRLSEADSLDNRALVAIALLAAASDPAQKDLMIRLIINLIAAGE